MKRILVMGTRTVFATLLVLTASGFSGAALPSEAGDGPTVPNADCQKCEDASGGGGGIGHSFQSPGSYYSCSFCHIDWQPGYCGGSHENCAVEHDSLTLGASELAAFARTASASRVEDLLRLNKQSLRYNAKRGSIQAFGCAGQVVGDYPVSESARSELH